MKAGDKYDTRADGVVEVLEFNGSMSVKVKFENTGYEITTQASQVRTGKSKVQER